MHGLGHLLKETRNTPLSWAKGRMRWRVLIALVMAALIPAGALPGSDTTTEELKARLAAASINDRPHLCVQIAQKQLAEAARLYSATEVEKAQTILPDVVTYSELARDYALQSHKYQKQTEIAARVMTRQLTDILHGLAHDDQAPVQDAISHLQRVRDDLLQAMFPKGAK